MESSLADFIPKREVVVSVRQKDSRLDCNFSLRLSGCILLFLHQLTARERKREECKLVDDRNLFLIFSRQQTNDKEKWRLIRKDSLFGPQA